MGASDLNSLIAEKVVPLSQDGHDTKSTEQFDFGVKVSRAQNEMSAANEDIASLLTRLVVDDSLPLYLASVDCCVMYWNEQYQALDKMLDSDALVPGRASVGQGYKAFGLEPIISDIKASNRAVRAEEIVMVNGRERVFLGRHMPVRDEQGKLIAIAGTYEDVTLQVRGVEEIAKAQARFQDFTRASSDWFFETDNQMRVCSLSDRFTAIVGQPAQMFINARFDQIGQLSHNLDGVLEGPRCIAMRKPFRDQLLEITGGDGQLFKFHLSAVPIFDRSGDFLGYRGVGVDETSRYMQSQESERAKRNLEVLLQELTRKNIALDKASEAAKSALRSKNEFLAAMSHELRTPLNAIIGFAESFTQEAFGNLQAQYIEYAKDIGTSGQHLLELINDILDVALLEGGQLRLRVCNTGLGNIVENAVHMVTKSAIDKGLDISGLDKEIPYTVSADERRLRQIFVNLLTNAVKFTPEGGRIGLNIEVLEESQEVSVSVWDTGIGIAEEKLPTIFDKFEQVTDDIYSRTQEGTGLGLFIARELARGMNGDLTVISTEGKGSRFTCRIPLATVEHCDDDNFI